MGQCVSIGKMKLREILSDAERHALLQLEKALLLSEEAIKARDKALQERADNLVPDAGVLGLNQGEAITLAYLREVEPNIVFNGQSQRVASQRAANNSKG